MFNGATESSTLIDLSSVILLVTTITTAILAVRGFKQSRQALVESASLITVIVGSLTSRIEKSETLLYQLGSSLDSVNRRQTKMEGESSFRAGYFQLLNYIQELLTNDKRFVTELEKMKAGFAAFIEAPRSLPHKRELILGGNVMETLTPTESQVIDIIGDEGAKAAPELGRRLNKSREHMARLMKKLYLEGYVDRESNRTPFRYKLSGKLRSTMENKGQQTVTAPSET